MKVPILIHELLYPVLSTSIVLSASASASVRTSLGVKNVSK